MTTKEEDVQVGLVYFGKRYLNTSLQRWISADPLTIHGLGADLNAYAYVSGAVLKMIDPLGLADEDPNQGKQDDFFSMTQNHPGRARAQARGNRAIAPPAQGSSAGDSGTGAGGEGGGVPGKMTDTPMDGGACTAGGNCTGGGKQKDWTAGDSATVLFSLLNGDGSADVENGKSGGVPGGTCTDCEGSGWTQFWAGIGQALSSAWGEVASAGKWIGGKVAGAFSEGWEAAGSVYARVKLRKGTRKQIEANQPRNDAGDMVDPNTGDPLKPGEIDTGHKPGQEWRKRKRQHEERGSTRKEVIEAENDPDLYQLEDRHNNRSHRYEDPDD